MCDTLEISRLIAQCLQFLGFAARVCELIKSMESLSELNNEAHRGAANKQRRLRAARRVSLINWIIICRVGNET